MQTRAQAIMVHLQVVVLLAAEVQSLLKSARNQGREHLTNRYLSCNAHKLNSPQHQQLVQIQSSMTPKEKTKDCLKATTFLKKLDR